MRPKVHSASASVNGSGGAGRQLRTSGAGYHQHRLHPHQPTRPRCTPCINGGGNHSAGGEQGKTVPVTLRGVEPSSRRTAGFLAPDFPRGGPIRGGLLLPGRVAAVRCSRRSYTNIMLTTSPTESLVPPWPSRVFEEPSSTSRQPSGPEGNGQQERAPFASPPPPIRRVHGRCRTVPTRCRSVSLHRRRRMPRGGNLKRKVRSHQQPGGCGQS
jgi:hypothetical protein